MLLGALLALDIGHFKAVNDTFGHAGGDRVLTEFVRICAQSLREIDILGRLGGEEFAVILSQTPGAAAVEVAERLRSAVESMHIALDDGRTLAITVSIGVASAVGAVRSSENLLGDADDALYEAKRAGRNRTCVAPEVQGMFPPAAQALP